MPTNACNATAERLTAAVTRKKHGISVHMFDVGMAPRIGPATTPVITAVAAENAATRPMRPGTAARWLVEYSNEATM